MNQPYARLTIGLGTLAAAAGVAGVLFLSDSNADVHAEVGKWMLTLAVGLALTGALSMVVKLIDQRRSERDAWHAVLDELVTANQIVLLARSRLGAHRTAKTYQEQSSELMRARVILRQLRAIGIVSDDPPLQAHITAMAEYLDAFGWEYEKGYLRVARQQRLDELWLDAKLKETNEREAGGTPRLPAPLELPTEAWRLLADASRFPRLAALLDTDVWSIDRFRGSYKLAKGRLEAHAGVSPPAAETWIGWGRKLSNRTTTFLRKHGQLPPDVQTPPMGSVLKELDRAREQLDRACKSADTRAVETAVAKVYQAASSAISVVYADDHRRGSGRGDAPVAANEADSTEGHS
jgi:hypothetical protein